jgi:hypothetical protein
VQVRLAKEKADQKLEEKVVRAKEELSMHEEGLTFINGVATTYSRWKPSPELRATLHAHKDEVCSTTVIHVIAICRVVPVLLNAFSRHLVHCTLLFHEVEMHRSSAKAQLTRILNTLTQYRFCLQRLTNDCM